MPKTKSKSRPERSMKSDTSITRSRLVTFHDRSADTDRHCNAPQAQLHTYPSPPCHSASEDDTTRPTSHARKCASTSSGNSGNSTSSNYRNIPEYVSEWKATGLSVTSAGDVLRCCVFDPLYVKLKTIPDIDKYLDHRDPCQQAVRTRDDPPADIFFACPKLADNEIKLLETIANTVCFDIYKFMYNIDGGSHSTYRRKLPHGAWPEQIPKDQQTSWLKEVETSISRLEIMKHEAMKKHEQASHHLSMDCELAGEICSYEAAKRFVQEVDSYLHEQPRIREDGFTQLFRAFIEVVGLKNIRCGRSRSASQMTIYDKQTYSEPDLLILQPHNAAIDNPNVIAVAKIKARCLSSRDSPDVQSNSDENTQGCQSDVPKVLYESASAQMLGDLILEMPNALIRNHLLGFLLMGTEVTLCHLYLPQELLDFYQMQGTNRGKYRGRQRACYSIASDGLDIMKNIDRLRLWKCLARLKHLKVEH